MFRRARLIGVLLALLVVTTVATAGCHSPTQPLPPQNPPNNPQPQPDPQPTPVYTLGITRILAFGDSMTEGTVSPSLRPFTLDAGRAESYPFKLQALISARYTTQTVSVFNGGLAGRRASEDRSRLSRNISDSSPQLVILLEGANDLNSIVGPSTNAAVDAVVGSMEDMVRDTTGRGLPVLLATLPPQRPPKGAPVSLLARYNDGLKAMAAKKGATIVDINALLPESFVGSDGLHPTEAGYQRMAEIFLDAIKQRYEASSSLAAHAPTLDVPYR